MLSLRAKRKLILEQTMLEEEAIAAFRASPLHRGTTKIVVVVYFTLFVTNAFWPWFA